MMKYVLCVALLAVSFEFVRALEEEDKAAIREVVVPQILECAKQYGIDEATLMESKQKGSLEGLNKCFFACIFKKIGIMDAEGKFVPEKALEKAKKYEKTEEDFQAHSAVIEECSAVNTANVSDGAAGCDRAKLLADCLKKNKKNILGD